MVLLLFTALFWVTSYFKHGIKKCVCLKRGLLFKFKLPSKTLPHTWSEISFKANVNLSGRLFWPKGKHDQQFAQSTSTAPKLLSLQLVFTIVCTRVVA